MLLEAIYILCSSNDEVEGCPRTAGTGAKPLFATFRLIYRRSIRHSPIQATWGASGTLTTNSLNNNMLKAIAGRMAGSNLPVSNAQTFNFCISRRYAWQTASILLPSGNVFSHFCGENPLNTARIWPLMTIFDLLKANKTGLSKDMAGMFGDQFSWSG
jgi:hypothetical protein